MCSSDLHNLKFPIFDYGNINSIHETKPPSNLLAAEVDAQLPRFHFQIFNHPLYQQIKEAEDKEYQTLVNMGAWSNPMQLPAGQKALATQWVYKAKGDNEGKLTGLLKPDYA